MVAWLVFQMAELLNYNYGFSIEEMELTEMYCWDTLQIKQMDCEAQALYPVIPPTKGKIFQKLLLVLNRILVASLHRDCRKALVSS